MSSSSISPKSKQSQLSKSQSDLSVSFEEQEFNRIYTNKLKKAAERKKRMPQDPQEKMKGREKQSRSRSREKRRVANWHIYEICENLEINKDRFSPMILNLPILKKSDQILHSIVHSQVVLITGQTGCGKSTQVPRLIYEYIRATGLAAKIICVQPRRLAVKNLHRILTDQIPENGAVGFHIAMQTFIRENTKILFMTNGIFLQRLIHSTQFFEEYPFIILDEVHERDIDTDFILLSMKRIMRLYPKLRVILMSATIDNKLFQYYFAEDEIDNFMSRQNFYKQSIRLEQELQKMKQEAHDDQNEYVVERVGQEEELLKKMEMPFLKAKYPCPTINVTEKGKYKKEYFYLDTIHKFVRKDFNIKWGTVCFSHKYPATHKQLYEAVCVIMESILERAPRDRSNEAILIFLPGLSEIENCVSEVSLYFGKKVDSFELVKCHSSILNDEITKKLHNLYQHKIKVIVATNIAESSITVLGIKYVVDFCLSKEINYDQKSRMENLDLVWASQASCEQRAGRTGRVCDGFVIRLVEQEFFKKFSKYSTPEIQRSSLDRLILRIKLIHQNENGAIFEDPGDVLGTAIQPPNLKNIDEAIKELIICGGLKVENEKLVLTKLGLIYVDVPLDIIYTKLLMFSILMGTYQDILILVCILSQNKNAFKKAAIDRNPLDYFEKITNEERCDFLALIQAYKQKRSNIEKGYRTYNKVDFDIYYETKLLVFDISKRIMQKKILSNLHYCGAQSDEEYKQKFKMTIAYGFLTHLLKAVPMIYDDKQEKRAKLMKKQNIPTENTIILLNSDIIRKSTDGNEEANNRLKNKWIENISHNLRVKPSNIDITLGYGISFLHFKRQIDLNKLLFVKSIQKKQGSLIEQKSNNLTLGQILPHLGDIDYMEEGTTIDLLKGQKISIDNNSGNRVIGVKEDNFERNNYRLLITNSIIQQSTRLSCRFSSLLPDVAHLETILYLVFYPFVVLVPDRKNTKYDSIYLRKRTKVKINYELTDEEISDANRIREVIKELMSLTLFVEDVGSEEQKNQNEYEGDSISCILDDPRMKEPHYQQKFAQLAIKQKAVKEKKEQTSLKIEKMRNFWPMLHNFICRERKKTVGEEKWQDIYFLEKKIQHSNVSREKPAKSEQKEYMNKILPLELNFSYFSSHYNHMQDREQRIQEYEEWKMSKLREVRKIEEKALDHDPYIICSTCKVKIAKLSKLGSITNQYYREVFEYVLENVTVLPYNELGDYFCSMLMTLYNEKQYDVYGCCNGHYFAVQYKDERRLKILAFSPISILYTDGSIEEEPEFQALEFKKWRPKFESSKLNKIKKLQTNFCFVCNEKFQTIRQLQTHVKSLFHESNVKEFSASISKANKSVERENQINPY